MLTRRLWFSALGRLRWGRAPPPIFKTEYVITYEALFPLHGKEMKRKKGKKTFTALVEARCITFQYRY